MCAEAEQVFCHKGARLERLAKNPNEAVMGQKSQVLCTYSQYFNMSVILGTTTVKMVISMGLMLGVEIIWYLELILY